MAAAYFPIQMASENTVVEIDPSPLGTLDQYDFRYFASFLLLCDSCNGKSFIWSCTNPELTFSWNKAYERELANFEGNEGDIGEVWFGEDVQERVCDWIALGCQDDEGEESEDPAQYGSEAFPGVRHMKSRVLDVGCGNAAALVYLAKEYNFEHLTGVDYSEPGIELARKVVAREEATSHISLAVLDLMHLDGLYQRHLQGIPETFDILFDKGTFDAICLNEDKTMRSKYVSTIVSMMKTNSSYFVITSCNWTQAEVIQMFESMSLYEVRQSNHAGLAKVADHEGKSLKMFKTLKHPEFSFGGRTGSAVATVAFKLM